MFERNGDDKLLKYLRGDKNWTLLGDELAAIAQSNPKRLARVYLRLTEADGAPSPDNKAYHFAKMSREFIRKALALAGTEPALVALLSIIEAVPLTDIPELAAVMASGGDPKMLASHALRPYSPVLARIQPHLLHEMILRGRPVQSLLWEPITIRIQNNGPFGNLSIDQLPEEATPCLAGFSPGGMGVGMGNRSISTVRSKFEADLDIAVKMKREESIALVVKPWVEESNGRMISWRGSFEGPVRPLGLIARAPELGEATWIETAEIAPDQAFGLMHGAASHGGAYCKARYAAVGRLLAWQNIAAMMAMSLQESNTVLAKAMHRFKWHHFTTDAWFDHIAWEIGILCIDEQAKTFALMAGTDTD
ncbi:MAG: DUF6183 family protein [Bacteroidia bacterium]